MARPSLLKLSTLQWGMVAAFFMSVAFLVYGIHPFFSSKERATAQAMNEGSYTRLIVATGDIEGKPKPLTTTPTTNPAPKTAAPLPISVDAKPTTETTHTPETHSTSPVSTTTSEHAPTHTEIVPPAATSHQATPIVTATTAQPAAPDATPVMSNEKPTDVSPESAPPAAGQPLVIKTNPAILEVYKDKKIPRKSEDGSTLPCEYYARPDKTPRDMPVIALLVTGLGINTPLSNAAVNTLPAEISLSFSPYSNSLQDWIARSNHYGHEAWLDVPMEFADYPASDPGPLGLLKKATEAENLERLKTTFATATGYVGLVAPKDEIFTGYTMMEMMHHEIANRGLLLLLRSRAYKAQADASSVLYSSRALVREKSSAEALQSLKDLEAIAKDYGFAVGVIDASPSNFDTVNAWAKELAARHMTLVPLSAIPSRHH